MSLSRFLKLSGRLWLQDIKRKAQLCQQSVRYLGLIISEGTRAIGPEKIKPILNHPLPMTLRQLRRFLGITDYCHIWIPGYGELARPCINLELKLSRPQQTNWFGLQILKRLFKVLQTALLQAPAFSLLQGQDLICH